MDILRGLEQEIESKIEGFKKADRDLHYLEAARVIHSLLLNSRFCFNGISLVPNMFLIPLEHPEKASKDYCRLVIENVNKSLAGRNFQFLTNAFVKLVSKSALYKDIEVYWADELKNMTLGFVMGTKGLSAGRFWSVPAGGTVIGRSSTVPICVPDPRMSRSHLEIKIVSGDRVTVKDLSSYNGTFIGRNRLDPAKVILVKNGRELILGDTGFAAYAFPNQYERIEKFSGLKLR